MLKYEHIKTQADLELFVEKLNKITHYERYLLFNFTFTTAVYYPFFKNRKVTGDVYDEMWTVKVGSLVIYATTRINRRIDADLETGMYESIYFHLNPVVIPGISQPRT